LLNEDFAIETEGGLGFAMRETDDGKIIANFVLSGGPAEQAGMEWGAEIISLDGKTHSRRRWMPTCRGPLRSATRSSGACKQLRYAARFPMDKGQVEVTFKNPDGAEQTAALDVVNERQSFSVGSFYYGQPATSLPVEYDIPAEWIWVYKDYQLWLIMMFFPYRFGNVPFSFSMKMKIPGVIIDMRYNGGGSGWLADQMAAYFFDEEIVTGNTARYSKDTGEFYMDPGDEAIMIPHVRRFDIMVQLQYWSDRRVPAPVNFSRIAMTINDRAVIVGSIHLSVRGQRRAVPDPEGIFYTVDHWARGGCGRQIFTWKEKGVVPTVKVPVTVETLQQQASGEDVILQAAEEALANQ